MLISVVGCATAPSDRNQPIDSAVGPADIAAMAAGTWQSRGEDQQGMAVLGGLLAYDMTTTQQVEGVAVARERVSAGPLWIAGTTESRALTSAGEESHGNWFFPFWRYEEVNGERTLYPLMVIPIPLGGADPSEYAQLEAIAPETASIDEMSGWDEIDDAEVTSIPPAADPIETLSALDAGANTYRLRQGDTLWSLSERFYGTGQRWRDIASANEGTIGNINAMPVGSTIQIPN